MLNAVELHRRQPARERMEKRLKSAHKRAEQYAKAYHRRLADS
jgi:hypothetical protein